VVEKDVQQAALVTSAVVAAVVVDVAAVAVLKD